MKRVLSLALSVLMVLSLLAQLVILLSPGCSKEDTLVEITDWAATENVSAGESAKYLTFFEKASEEMDYCRALTCTDAGLEVVLQSNASITLPAGTPYLALSPEGRLVHYAAGTAAAEEFDIELNVRDTWYEAPTLAVSADGFLIVAGRETDIVSTGRCVMDCGKYVYYYAGSSVVPVASEIRERFNPPLPKDRGLLKVLFVGNSFNVDATAHLPGILTADGTQRVLMGRVYHGGCTLPQYDDNYEADRFCSYRTWRPGEKDWDGDEEYDTNLKYAVEAEDWDVVTFMEYTGNSCCWSWTEEEKGHINSLIDRVFAAHPEKRPTVLFMLTQTFAAQSDLVATYFDSDQMKMYETITDFAQQVLDGTCIDDVIATGTVLQNLRTSKLQNAMDMTRDGYHMDYGISRYAASCAVFEKLISPAFGGVTLDGNPFRYTTSNTTHGSYSTPVTEANAPIALQAARYALTTPYAVTDMSHIGQERPDNGIEDTEFEEDQNKE